MKTGDRVRVQGHAAYQTLRGLEGTITQIREGQPVLVDVEVDGKGSAPYLFYDDEIAVLVS